MQYRTIVADPPWPGAWWSGGSRRAGRSSGSTRVYPEAAPSYETMTIEDICAIPVVDLAETEAHLYLWVPDLHLIEGNAARVARAWGFRPGRVILWWAKRNAGLGKFPRPAHEAILVCTRGSLPFAVADVASVQEWRQPYAGGAKEHSAKPDGMLDLVERASPGPYVELFARRARFGWDYWGDESLGTAELTEVASDGQ